MGKFKNKHTANYIWIKYVVIVFEQHISCFTTKTNHERNWGYCTGEIEIYFLYSIDTLKQLYFILIAGQPHNLDLMCQLGFAFF